MPNYRRSNTDGATYFFTVVTHQRRRFLCDDDVRRALRDAVEMVRVAQPFVIDAWVLMPDHLHTIWTLPENDADFGARWGKIKKHVSAQCGERLHQAWRLNESKTARHESSLWQRRFWEHQIRDEADFARCMDYAYFNPVKHGLVQSVAGWKYSTFHRDVARGLYPERWGDGLDLSSDGFGE